MKAPARIKAIDWSQVANRLDAQGSAVIEKLVSPDECEALAALYPSDELFRSRVVMAHQQPSTWSFDLIVRPFAEKW